MSVTIEQVKGVLQTARNSDQTLAQLIDASNKLGVSMNDAAKVGAAIANIAIAKGVGNDAAANSLVDAFKAALYQGLVQKGQRLPDNMHNALTQNFQAAVAMIKQQQGAQSGGSILGGGSGNAGGGSISLALAGGGGIPLTVEPVTTAPAPSASLSVLTAGVAVEPAATLTAATVAPTAPAQTLVFEDTQNNPQIASLSGDNSDNLNDSLFDLMDGDMETYAAHELEVKLERVSKTAKQANNDVKLFSEGGNWREELSAITTREAGAVYFNDADILVRIDEDLRTYYVGHDESDKDIIRSFFETHRVQMDGLAKAQEITDVEKLIALVSGTVAKLRKNAVDLFSKVNAGDFSTVTTASETRRFINSYLYLLDIHVHNALSIMTVGGTVIPTGRRVSLERKAEDLEYFTTNVFQSTVGENGESTEEDWFRELLEMVAVSLGKHLVRMEDGGTMLILSHTLATVVIPGTYGAVDKEHVIGTHTLSATSDAVTEIFEELYKHKPNMNVILETPTGKHLLLSCGGVGAAIRY
ncbi:hypothetical protein pEaSNUABM11_00097 [Erwinia phage pEa_SNUABM_11]|nr:hypothetical protein pEaSNUABM11_00097 [Erwinia phage pEa_SNUABM_11]